MNDEMRSDSGQACAQEHAGRGHQNLKVAAAGLPSREQFDVVVGIERLATDGSRSTKPSVSSAGAAEFRSTIPIEAVPPTKVVGLGVTDVIVEGLTLSAEVAEPFDMPVLTRVIRMATGLQTTLKAA
jgi:hypothetical protein